MAAFCILALPSACAAGIVIDGSFDDWNDITPFWTDAPGDGDASGVDFGEVSVWSDAERFYISFETGREIGLQGERGLVLAVELDGDATTGRADRGIGIDFEWHFGLREGVVFGTEGKERVLQADVGLRQAPTVTSDRFEVAFERGFIGADIAVLEPGTIRFFLEDADGGDVAPDDPADLYYVLREASPPGPSEPRMGRENPSDLRVLTYNVLFDGLFERPDHFRRVLNAVDPDIICFQEIYHHGNGDVERAVASALPGPTWSAVGERDCFIVSRYPVARSQVLGPVDENVWALVDLPDDEYQFDLSIVSAHPPCCNKTAERQEEFDIVMAWLRDLMPGDERVEDVEPVEHGTLTVIAGDMNLVTDSYQLRTLTDGAIRGVDRFGPPFAPDWDGTPLEDAFPLHLTGLEAYTWRSDDDTYAPGRLDFVIFSDSVARKGNAFVLWTPDLPREALERAGLRADDTVLASDHLPVVVDLVPLVGR
jgi:endonuclease/exonuclease/phosphatase family metal-dependent hydrolase